MNTALTSRARLCALTLAVAALGATALPVRAQSAPDGVNYPVTYRTGTMTYRVTAQDELSGHMGPGLGSSKSGFRFDAGTLHRQAARTMEFHVDTDALPVPAPQHTEPGVVSSKTPWAPSR